MPVQLVAQRIASLFLRTSKISPREEIRPLYLKKWSRCAFVDAGLRVEVPQPHCTGRRFMALLVTKSSYRPATIIFVIQPSFFVSPLY